MPPFVPRPLNPRLLAALACLLLLPAMGKRDRYTVSFHIEATSEESDKLVFSHEVGQPPMARYFRRLPDITHRDFAAFHTFPAEDGNSFGAVLQLTEEGARKLSVVTSSSAGSLMRVLVNGQGADVLYIDRPIMDGRLTVWSGIPAEVVREMERSLERLAGRAEVVEPSAEPEPTPERAPVDELEPARGYGAPGPPMPLPPPPPLSSPGGEQLETEFPGPGQ